MENRLVTDLIIRSAIRVHRNLGPGLLESAYEECLCFEFSKASLEFERQKPLPLIYEGVKLDCGYRIDLLVEDQVIVEVKSVQMLIDIHLAQILTYLRISDRRVGLLINFNALRLKDGIKRVVNNFEE